MTVCATLTNSGTQCTMNWYELDRVAIVKNPVTYLSNLAIIAYL